MTIIPDSTEAGDLRDHLQGAFTVLHTAINAGSHGGPYANIGEPKTLSPYCMECNRRFVRLGALCYDGCLDTMARAGAEWSI